jgi:hypothetical protein
LDFRLLLLTGCGTICFADMMLVWNECMWYKKFAKKSRVEETHLTQPSCSLSSADIIWYKFAKLGVEASRADAIRTTKYDRYWVKQRKRWNNQNKRAYLLVITNSDFIR